MAAAVARTNRFRATANGWAALRGGARASGSGAKPGWVRRVTSSRVNPACVGAPAATRGAGGAAGIPAPGIPAPGVPAPGIPGREPPLVRTAVRPGVPKLPSGGAIGPPVRDTRGDTRSHNAARGIRSSPPVASRARGSRLGTVIGPLASLASGTHPAGKTPPAGFRRVPARPSIAPRRQGVNDTGEPMTRESQSGRLPLSSPALEVPVYPRGSASGTEEGRDERRAR